MRWMIAGHDPNFCHTVLTKSASATELEATPPYTHGKQTDRPMLTRYKPDEPGLFGQIWTKISRAEGIGGTVTLSCFDSGLTVKSHRLLLQLGSF